MPADFIDAVLADFVWVFLVQCGRAVALPVEKDKQRTQTESYRPIVLTSGVGKLLEIIVNNRLQYV